MNLEKFSLQGLHASERSLTLLGHKVVSGERITRDLFRQHGSIVLGDMILSNNHRFYTTDDDAILGRCYLPYTDGIAWFESVDGLAHQCGWIVGTNRLSEIKQLALLHPPVRQGEAHLSLGFNHNRFVHTYDVYAIGMIIAQNMGVSGADFMALRLSLIVHDLFTPACGDLMKFVDAKAYDEDALLDRLLSNEGWVYMCRALGVDMREPIRIAQEKDGVLCSIRDLADTLAYVARDLHMFHGIYRESWKGAYEDESDGHLEEELRAVSGDSCSLDLWSYVRPGASGRIVIENHEKLYRFLFARACLFRLLYYHRQTRNVEYIIGIRLIKILIQQGKLSYENFFDSRGMDSFIWEKVFAETGFNCNFFHDGRRGRTRFFEDLSQAVAHAAEACGESPESCALIYRWPSKTKSKVGEWNVCLGGKEMPWGTAYPEKARRIEEIMRLPSGVHVAIISRRQFRGLKPEYWEILRNLSEDTV